MSILGVLGYGGEEDDVIRGSGYREGSMRVGAIGKGRLGVTEGIQKRCGPEGGGLVAKIGVHVRAWGRG